MFHAQVAFRALVLRGYVSQSGTDQHQCGLTIWKTAHHTRRSTEFTVQPFQDIVGHAASPVLMGKVQVGQRLFYALCVQVRGRFKTHVAKFLLHIYDLLHGGLAVLLCVCGLQQRHRHGKPVTGNPGHHVPEEVHRASLPLGFGEHLRDRFQEAQVLVREQPHVPHSPFLEACQEGSPAFLAFACTFAGAKNLAVAFAVDTDCNQYGDDGHLAAPAALEVDSVHENVGILPGYGPVTSSTRRTETPARYISMMAVSKGARRSFGIFRLTSPAEVSIFLP